MDLDSRMGELLVCSLSSSHRSHYTARVGVIMINPLKFKSVRSTIETAKPVNGTSSCVGPNRGLQHLPLPATDTHWE